MHKYQSSSAWKAFRSLTVVMVVAMVAAACAPAATPAPTSVPATAVPATVAPTAAASGMDALVAAAKAEGTLTTIALPRDWCNYGAAIDGFTKKYGIAINNLTPDAGSGDEVNAIKANKDNKGPQAPDVIDVGLSFGPSSKTDGLIQPYKVSTWADIPDSAKDADGFWYGDYYGVLSFMVNTDVQPKVPQDWSDLLAADYKGQVAFSGDPRVSNQAIQSVVAAGLANGGTADNPQAGLDFFAKVNKAGNLVPVIATNALVAKGEVAVRLTWDYNALAGRDGFKGNPKVQVVVPKTGRVAGVYVQAISAYAPHPNAAKLWMEYLYSDEGQLIWLAPPGYCHPIRQDAMDKAGKIPAAIKAQLPDVTGAVFPSLDAQNAAKTLITANWDKVVGADVKKAP